MPRYDYECGECGHVFELRQSFSAEPVGVCPRCEGASRRKFHAVPIIFKGSGFYVTDYKRSGYSPPAKEKEKEKSEKSEESGTEKSKDSKSDGDGATEKAVAAKDT